MSMEDVIAAVPMMKPPMSVNCRTCKEECSAQLVRTGILKSKKYGRWQFSCSNPRCTDLGVQHKSQPVPMS